MECEHVKCVQEEPRFPATQKQLMYLDTLAKSLNFQVNTQGMSKDEAGEKITQLKNIIKTNNSPKNKDKEVKLGMVKKLVYKKWVAQNKEINKQTERLFMKDVYYLNQLFDRIDQLILSEQAA